MYCIRVLALVSILLVPLHAFALSEVSSGATSLGKEIDAQMSRRIGEGMEARKSISIIITTPVLLGDFKKTNLLAKQMAEELMRYFVDAGYRVNELRKGDSISINEESGETILTRDASHIVKEVSSEAILAGTYTVSGGSVRFNMRLLHTPSNEVLAMSSVSVPITEEVVPLLRYHGDKPVPSIGTKLP